MKKAVAEVNNRLIIAQRILINIPNIHERIIFGDSIAPAIGYFNATNGFFK